MFVGSNTMRRWVGAAIAGLGLALGVLALLGALTSPRFAVARRVEARIVAFYRTVVCDCSGLPIRGLVITRNPDHGTSPVPDALFCYPRNFSADGCAYPIGSSGPEGSFDVEVDFGFVSVTDEREGKATVVVSAPGCTPTELRVRRRGPYQVILDCPHRSSGPPPAPPIPVSAVPSV